jgi:hypothetical protein
MGLLPLRGRSLETALDGASASAFEMIAELSDYARLEQEGKGLGRQPQVPSRIEVTLPGREAKLKLSLSDMTDGRRRDKISDVQFDLERLLKIHDPERVRELRSGATADSEPAAKPAESQ